MAKAFLSSSIAFRSSAAVSVVLKVLQNVASSSAKVHNALQYADAVREQ